VSNAIIPKLLFGVDVMIMGSLTFFGVCSVCIVCKRVSTVSIICYVTRVVNVGSFGKHVLGTLAYNTREAAAQKKNLLFLLYLLIQFSFR
jgi:hypothetical protein